MKACPKVDTAISDITTSYNFMTALRTQGTVMATHCDLYPFLDSWYRSKKKLFRLQPHFRASVAAFTIPAEPRAQGVCPGLQFSSNSRHIRAKPRANWPRHCQT